MRSLPQQLLALALLLMVGGWSNSAAQDFDFEERPALPVDYRHLDLELDISQDPLQISGRAVYRFEARVDSVAQLTLHAAHMDINSVEVDGESVDFEITNDTLQIMLAKPAGFDARKELAINYTAEPRFGILTDRHGTIWTSRLPKSNAHWLPVVDHPRVQFTVDMALTVSPAHKAVASGIRQGSEVHNVDEKVVRFSSNTPMAATDLFFASGPFEVTEQAVGPRSLRLYSETGLWSSAEQDEIRQKTYDLLKKLERTLNFEYPWPALNVVMLEDHHWETKTYGASTIVLYKNMGSIEAQLARGLAAQWFGTWQREEQWLVNQGSMLHQIWLLNQAGLAGDKLVTQDRPDVGQYVVYDAFGPKVWKQWKSYWKNGLDPQLKSVLNRTAREQIKRMSGVYTWEDYADLWYDRSGQPWYEAPNPRGSTPIDSLVYEVTYSPAEDGQSLSISFQALSERYAGELVNAELLKVEGGDTTTSTITFTGQRDSIVAQTTPMLETASVRLPAETGPLRFVERKPLPFLIYELRNASTAEARAAAADRLSEYADSPDLQLALQDILQNEQHPKVLAAIYRTLGAVIGGDTGTEQIFLDVLRSEVSREVKQAALVSLSYYPENDQVTRVIRQYAMDLTRSDLAQTALAVYRKVSVAGEFRETAASVLRADTTFKLTREVLLELEKAGQQSAVVTHAADYLGADIPYPLRSEALRLLLQYDKSSQGWEARIKQLSNDLDPRIRYLVMKAVDRISQRAARSLLEGQMLEEYDVRVLIRMNNLMQSKP